MSTVPVIAAHDLSKTLNGRTILNGLSFEVEGGEVFGLLGPNGAGKTTTLRLLLGLLEPTSGQALVLGAPLGENAALRRRVGVLLEDDGLYPRLSAYENLDYYAHIYQIADARERITTLLDRVGLSDRTHSRVGAYSRGMRRRLALARSILHDPDVLFYDEPSSGLDPEAQKMVRDLIRTLATEKGRTVFLNSHDLAEVQRICSKIAILHRGEIQLSGAVDSLRRQYRTRAVELTLADDDEAERARTLLRSLGGVSACERKGARLIARIDDGGPSTLLTALVNGRLRVEEVKPVTTSVEDIYLNVVRQSEGRR